MLEDFAGRVLALLFDASLKSLLLLLTAGLALLCLRHASAAARHLALLLTLLCLLLLPLLSSTLPGWHVRWPQTLAFSTPAPQTLKAPLLNTPPLSAPPPATRSTPPADAVASPPAVPDAPRPTPLPWPLLGCGLWLIGVCVVLLPVGAGLVCVHRLGQRSLPISADAVTQLCAGLAQQLGVRRAVTLRRAAAEAASPVPMTWGWRRPLLLLPTTAEEWPADRLRAVLLHELAHIQRRDWLWQMLAHVVCALYWFHPGVWLMAHALRAESERACDDQVLSTGIPAPEYARHLVDVARTLSRATATTGVALPMATSQVQNRVLAILKTQKRGDEMTKRSATAATVAAASLLLPLALLRPGSGAQTITNSPQPPPIFTVVVDPGHGGQDTGAVGLDGTFEKDLDLSIAGKLRDTLTKQGVRVVMTRTGDTSSLPAARSAFVRANGAQYLVSIHCDKEGANNSHTGVLIFYHGGRAQGKLLAAVVLARVTNGSRLPVNGFRSDATRFPKGFSVLRNSPVPAVLVECGYMNNARDLAALHQERTQQQVADGIAAGLEQFASNQTRASANAAVSAVSAAPGEMDANKLEAEGKRLTPKQAEGLEREVASDPNDITLHIKLLGCYSRASLLSAPNARRDAQILWLIRFHPENVLLGTPDTMILPRQDGDAYAEAKRLWLSYAAAPSANPKTLGNGASFLTFGDFPDAERLYLMAEAAEPKNTNWPDQLGHLYQLEEADRHGLRPDYQTWAGKALAQYEQAAALLAPRGTGGFLLTSMATAAYDSGAYDKAKSYAQRLLHSHEDDDAVHHGNMILGRLALRDGDTAEATARLLAMGRVYSSPVLGSFGPNMQLAQDLLQHGDRQTVLEYLGECANFWHNDYGALHRWRTQIEHGEMPDFGGNLVY